MEVSSVPHDDAIDIDIFTFSSGKSEGGSLEEGVITNQFGEIFLGCSFSYFDGIKILLT